MKLVTTVLAALFLTTLAQVAVAQNSAVEAAHRLVFHLRGEAVAPIVGGALIQEKPETKVAPLNAKLGFAVSVPEPRISFPSDGGDHEILGKLTNLTDTAIGLNFHRAQFLPNQWTSSVCFGTLCLSPSSDSGKYPFAFAPHETQDLIVHVYPTTFQIVDSARITLVVSQVPGTSADTIILHLVGASDGVQKVDAPAAGLQSEPPSIVTIYPNPATAASGQMTAQIFAPASSAASVSIYDLLGRKLREITLSQRLEQGINVLRFDPTGLTSGTYILGVDLSNGGQISKRFEFTR